MFYLLTIFNIGLYKIQAISITEVWFVIYYNLGQVPASAIQMRKYFQLKNKNVSALKSKEFHENWKLQEDGVLF